MLAAQNQHKNVPALTVTAQLFPNAKLQENAVAKKALAALKETAVTLRKLTQKQMKTLLIVVQKQSRNVLAQIANVHLRLHAKQMVHVAVKEVNVAPKVTVVQPKNLLLS